MQLRQWFFFATLLFSSLSFAVVPATHHDSPVKKYFATSCWHPLLTLTAGGAFSDDFGRHQFIPPHDGVLTFFDYQNTSSTQSEPIYGAFLGIEYQFLAPISVQGGISYYRLPNYHGDGIVTQGVDVPSQNKYTYYYYFQSHQLFAETKILYHPYRYNLQRYHPYLSAAVGGSSNATHDFKVNIDPPFTTFSNQFGDHTSRSVAYTLGLGLDVDVVSWARIGFRYQFLDIGQSRTANAMIDDVPTTNRLSQGHTNLNAFEAQLTMILL